MFMIRSLSGFYFTNSNFHKLFKSRRKFDPCYDLSKMKFFLTFLELLLEVYIEDLQCIENAGSFTARRLWDAKVSGTI